MYSVSIEDPISSQLQSPNSQNFFPFQGTYEDSPESDATEVPSDWLEQNSPRSSQNSSEVSSVEDMTHCFKSMGNTTVEMSHRPSLASRGSQYGKPKRYVEMYIPRVEQDTDAETSKERLRPHVVVSDCSTDEKADISRNYSSTGEKKIVEGDQEDGIELEYQKNYNWYVVFLFCFTNVLILKDLHIFVFILSSQNARSNEPARNGCLVKCIFLSKKDRRKI